MQAIVINLDRSPQRLRTVLDEIARHGLQARRLRAVDGRDLSDADIAQVLGGASLSRRLAPDEIATFLSHRKAWAEAAGAPDRWTLVLEDDVQLAHDVVQVLGAIETAPTDAGIVKLETTLRRVVLDKSGPDMVSGRQLRRMWSWHGGTAAYAVSRDCARFLMANTDTISDPVDQAIFKPSLPLFARCRPGQVFPAAAIQVGIRDRRGGGASDSTITRSDRLSGSVGIVRRLALKQIETVARAFMQLRSDRYYPYVDFADGRDG